MAGHTPGPWEVSPRDSFRVNVKTGLLLHPEEPRIATQEELDDLGDECHDDWNICQCNDEFYNRDDDECVANAILIAAAPDLLASCRQLLESGCSGSSDFGIAAWDTAVAQAESAIRKATGEPALPSTADVAAEFRARGEEDPFKGQ